MKKLDLGQTISVLANLGVIGGILLLAYELRQNNSLMEAEARFNRMSMAVNAWYFNTENVDLAELRERARNNEPLDGAEQRRVAGGMMALFVMLEWTFQELGSDSSAMNQVREVQRYNFSTDVSYSRVWEARKQSFDPLFVDWMQENVIDYVDR